VISSYVYWIAAGDRAHGPADASRLEALRALWKSYRVVDDMSPFDGASFWIDDGRPHACVIRTAHATARHPVEVVEVDPARIGTSQAASRSTP